MKKSRETCVLIKIYHTVKYYLLKVDFLIYSNDCNKLFFNTCCNCDQYIYEYISLGVLKKNSIIYRLFLARMIARSNVLK